MIALPGDRLQKATANSECRRARSAMGGLGFELSISAGRPKWAFCACDAAGPLPCRSRISRMHALRSTTTLGHWSHPQSRLQPRLDGTFGQPDGTSRPGRRNDDRPRGQRTLMVDGVVVPGWTRFAGAAGRHRCRQGIMNTVVFACRGRWADG